MNFGRLIEIGYALAEKTAETGRCNHITIITKKSKILSIAQNNYNKTHPQLKRFGYHPHNRLHSEMNAALKLGLVDCSGLTLVNLRINNNNQLDNSCPCFGCRNLIKSLNFKNAYYTNEFGTIQEFIY